MQLPARGGGAPRGEEGMLLSWLTSVNVKGMCMCVSGLFLGVPPGRIHLYLPICEDL